MRNEITASSTLEQRINTVCANVAQQFYSRAIVERRKGGSESGASLEILRKENKLWFVIRRKNEVHNITVPLPYTNKGVVLLTQNDVTRAVCNYFIKGEDLELDYLGIIDRIIVGEPGDILPPALQKKVSFIQQLAYSFQNNNTSIVVYNLQRAINEVVNRMPLHETNLNSLIMNQRLVIIDPIFNSISDPAIRLQYQVEKAREYFPRGWTSVGLADGNLSDKNYILKTDIRKLTPFGMKFHNPRRNLYSTLGMKGDELPLIRSQSMQNLMDQGVVRSGFNWFTLFVDTPDVFEDQIIINKKHVDKYVTYCKRYQIFGQVLVKKGSSLKYNQVIGISLDGQPEFFKIRCEKAKVSAINETEISVGGVLTKVSNVVVEYRRYFKDGFKVTNTHGNKGIIKLGETGYAIDPRTGFLREIDVIVSAKSIKKRKNYGQLLEAMVNTVNERPLSAYWRTKLRGNEDSYGGDTKNFRTFVIPDDYVMSMDQVQNRLEAEGFPRDGSWECNTYAGKLHGVAGTVFWGVIKTPEAAIWEKGATTRKNNKGLRTAGLKFSTVEFRSITTRFGKDNPILDEIMAYSQGSSMLHEELDILRCKKGVRPEGLTILDAAAVQYADQSYGTIIPREDTVGTIVDDTFMPQGFILRLPVWYQIVIDKTTGKPAYEGPMQPVSPALVAMVDSVFTFRDIYIPSGELRKCWRHATGKYGLSTYGVLVNNIITMCHRYIAEPNDINTRQLYTSIRSYFARAAGMLSTKRGDINTYGMAVRYPYSAKATAAGSSTLPKNTVEIHRTMAQQLEVKNGDVVLVERFPCLGFMSVRPQQVKITDDPQAQYVIRVSGNSLVSQSLDFDGDEIYIASFHTAAAKAALMKEWKNPNKTCYSVIQELNKKAGVPHTKCMDLDEYEIAPFNALTNEEHAGIVESLTGVKSHTGPVIAMAYNLMRLIENSDVRDNQKTNVAIEVFLDKVGNSVFAQKHGLQSLHGIVVEAICLTEIETLVSHGFNRETTTLICGLIRQKAASLGIRDLAKFHERAKVLGGNIITFLVKKQNKIYFASRSNLEGCQLLGYLDAEAVDVPSKMLKRTLAGKSDFIKTPLERHLDAEIIKSIKNEGLASVCKKLMFSLDRLCGVDTIKDSKRSDSKGA